MSKQGVFIRRRFKTRDELEEEVARHSGRVFVRNTSRSISEPVAYVRLLNEEQSREEHEKQWQAAMWFGNSPDPGPTVVLEHLTDVTGPGTYYIRPRTKKELREEVARDPASVYLEAMPTMVYEVPDYGGSLSEAPKDRQFVIVGPIPDIKHSWGGAHQVVKAQERLVGGIVFCRRWTCHI
jgi:hypothetical protein